MTISIDPQKTNNESLQPKGWLRYFSFSLDHKVIGIQYLVCGFLFYLIGGTLASAIRIELASPMSDFMPRDVYNQVLTLHGTCRRQRQMCIRDRCNSCFLGTRIQN